MKKILITTPIYYVNDVPSVGHSYTTIAADVLARWHRLRGDDVFFLTGLDENSQKTVEAAKVQGIKNIQKYTDIMAEKWKKVWEILDISYDGFIRTTEKRHQNLVKDFFTRVYKKGDIYKGHYRGLYCGECEAYLTEVDLVDGLCPYHKKKPEYISEENYFFKLSKYQDKLLKHIEKNPDFIQPISRRNEVIGFIKEGLQDISISRQAFEWGIPLPIDEKHRFWCWFDALLNYISGTKEEYWPATVHLMAKDILRFHAVIWPAMLLSAGYKLPKTIFAHGFLTIDGQKMSKSLGNVIDPIYLVNKHGLDPLRYFLFREIPFGGDGDFSIKRFEERYNSDLANGIGNLVARVLTLAAKYKLRDTNYKADKDTVKRVKETKNNYTEDMQNFRLFEALEEIWRLIGFCDKYIEREKPWQLFSSNPKSEAPARLAPARLRFARQPASSLAGEVGRAEGKSGRSQCEAGRRNPKLEKVLENLLYCISEIANLIAPFLPETSEKIKEQIKIGKTEILFPRL